MAIGFMPWRFVVTDRATVTMTFLDRLARNRSINAALGVPWSIGGDAPADSLQINTPADDDDPFLSYNTRFLYALREEEPQSWQCRASGIIMGLEDVAGTETPMSHFTAYDPRKYLYNRPLTRDDGRLVTNLLAYDGEPGHIIAQALLTNTDVAHGSCYIDYGQTDFYEGTIEPTDSLNIEFTQASSVGEAWAELEATGSLDIVLTPIYDPINRPGFLAELNIYVQAGDNRRNAIMAWDKPSKSLVAISHLRDGTAMANKVQGYTVDGQLGGPVQTNAASVAKYGQYWSSESSPGQAIPEAVELLALAQLLLRRRGKESLTCTPAPGRSPVPLLEYFPGDSVPIYASSNLRQEIAGLKRVYGIPIRLRDNGAETVDDLLLTEPDE